MGILTDNQVDVGRPTKFEIFKNLNKQQFTTIDSTGVLHLASVDNVKCHADVGTKHPSEMYQ